MSRDLKTPILNALKRWGKGRGLMVEAIALQHVLPESVTEQAGHGQRVRAALKEMQAEGRVAYRLQRWTLI